MVVQQACLGLKCIMCDSIVLFACLMHTCVSPNVSPCVRAYGVPFTYLDNVHLMAQEREVT